MIEEILETGTPITSEVVTESVPVVEVVPDIIRSDEEVEAMSKGWDPEYNGDGKVDAGEFLRREPLFGKIADLNRRSRDQEKLLRDLIERNRILAERDRTKELNELALKRKEAVSMGDEEAFEELDREYLKKSAEPVLPQTTSTIREYTAAEKKAFADFKVRNSTWVNVDTPETKKMVAAADSIYTILEEEMPGKSVAEYLRLTEDKVKAVFSHRFQNEARNSPQAVAGATRTIRKGSDLPSVDKLSDFQRHQCNLFVKSGGKAEEYIKQLRDLGRI